MEFICENENRYIREMFYYFENFAYISIELDIKKTFLNLFFLSLRHLTNINLGTNSLFIYLQD